MMPIRPADSPLDGRARRPTPITVSVRQLLLHGVKRLVESGLIWAERRRQRRAVLSLSDAMLRDIGLSRADIEREASKPFWQP